MDITHLSPLSDLSNTMASSEMVTRSMSAAFETGKIYLCTVRKFDGTNTRVEFLRYVGEDDCSWRTVDDNSELNYDWAVIQVSDVYDNDKFKPENKRDNKRARKDDL